MRSTAALVIAGIVLAASSNFAHATTPIAPVPPGAQLRVAVAQVRVAPDHRDWTYRLGESAKFTVSVTADAVPIDNATVTYTIGPDMFPGEKKSAAVPLEGLVIDAGTMKEPGFLRCIVTAEVAGRTYTGSATAAFEPEKIQPYQTDPDDFDAFWKGQLAELAKVPMEPILTPLPDASTDKVNVYHVSFRTVGPSWTKVPARIFGMLTEPKAPGKYPAVLKVPGAGVRPYLGDKGLAARGVITLEIGIHGIPVNLPESIYDLIGAGALQAYWSFNFDNRETYYYRRVYLSCIRANDFLTSRENWDGRNLVVMGASQGGQLSIVTAALDPRVTGLAATHPAGCDWPAPLHGRAGGWPHPFMPQADGSPSFHATPAKLETARYYDVVNFAKRLKVPGYYNWGYNDTVTPPTSVYAAYNVITAPKTLGLTLEMGHQYNTEQWEAIDRWVTQALGVK